MTRLGIYGRQSSDKQNPLSPDDQVRRCKDLAERFGISLDNCRVFIDEALSASGKDDAKRLQFHGLLAAWDAGELDVIIVDEWSRLTREGVEHARMVKRLEDNRRVRLITGNGLDTNLPNWQLVAGLFGMVGQQATRDTQYRVGRGMLGQLHRGFMIAAPAYGYDMQHDHDSNGRSVGARWVINEEQAAIVREVFHRRERGESMHSIARWLNASQIPTSRKPRKNNGGFWRPARVRTLLSQPIYRGQFHWHGSANYQNMAQKKGIETEIEVFCRPQLRLVSDQTWLLCNSKGGVSRTGYGGGKHALAGLFTCGFCAGVLAISGSRRTPSLCCPHCSQTKSAGGTSEGLTISVATAGAQLLLKEALRYFLTPTFIEAFRHSLRQRLSGDSRQEIERTESELVRLRRQQERLSRLLATSDEDDPVLDQRYEEARQSVRKMEGHLNKLLDGSSKLDTKAIEAQLDVDPAEMLEHVFNVTDVAPERFRVLLGRLFPRMVLEGKTGRYTSQFSICFAAGVALSVASGTSVVDEGISEMHFELRYRPDNRSGARGWSVHHLPQREANHRPSSQSLSSNYQEAST